MLSKKELYSKISSNIKTFVKSREKVLLKFLVDMIRGVIISRSVNLSAISRAIVEDSGTSVRHNWKRLERNIGNLDTSRSKEYTQGMMARRVDENTVIYFDPTEIVKPCGKRFEALSRVRDGSDKGEIKPGYPVTACIGMKGDEIIPLEFDPYSYKSEGFLSKNQEEYHLIDSIIIRSDSKGTYVFDRGFDSFSLVRHLQGMNVNFIIRMKDNRKYKPLGVGGESCDKDDIIERYGDRRVDTLLDMRVKKRFIKARCRIESARVELLGGKIDAPRCLTFVRVKTRVGEGRYLRLYLLTNIEYINPESLVQIVNQYLSRWKIEEFIRFVKQEYNLEKIKVLSLGRIKNMTNILYIVLVLITQIAELHMVWSKVRFTLIQYSKRSYKIPQKLKFFLYMVADGLAQVLSAMTKRVCQIVYKKRLGQLSFDFGKDYEFAY